MLVASVYMKCPYLRSAVALPNKQIYQKCSATLSNHKFLKYFKQNHNIKNNFPHHMKWNVPYKKKGKYEIFCLCLKEINTNPQLNFFGHTAKFLMLNLVRVITNSLQVWNTTTQHKKSTSCLTVNTLRVR